MTDKQVSRLCKPFANNSIVNVRSSKTRLSKIIQLDEFLGRFLGTLLKVGLQLIKNVLTPLAKSLLLVSLRLTAASSAVNARIHKKISGSGTTTLKVSNKKMDDIIKTAKSLKDSGLLLKSVTQAIENETRKTQRDRFFGMLFVWLS